MVCGKHAGARYVRGIARNAKASRRRARVGTDITVDIDRAADGIDGTGTGDRPAIPFVGAALEIDGSAVGIQGISHSQRAATQPPDNPSGGVDHARRGIDEFGVNIVVAAALVESPLVVESSPAVGIGEAAGIGEIPGAVVQERAATCHVGVIEFIVRLISLGENAVVLDGPAGHIQVGVASLA